MSRVDSDAYAAVNIEARASDVEWVGPRAVAHDAVLTWANESGGVVPFPMFTLFAQLDSVRAMLRDRGPALAALLERVAPCQEWSVRVFRLDAQVAATLGAVSPAIAELERRIDSASPGQRYLLERKADEMRGTEVRRVGADVARETFDDLSSRAERAVRDELPAGRQGEQPAGTAVLDASFLVRRERGEAFRQQVAGVARALDARGFHVDLSGPWPPYHFVGDDA